MGAAHALLAADPAKFFTDDHYRGFPAVLVRLPALDADELAELIEEAWRIQAPKTLVREFDLPRLRGTQPPPPASRRGTV
ncbi:hypothetical protein [Armatimonas sp.]|uniref:hypothetical protein n=1 Tax=Armatimonas sp. TaxID=1872638 RepID=UPI0037533CEF